jgi:Transposase IS66 family
LLGVHLADTSGQWCRFDLRIAAWVHTGRNRLEKSAADLATWLGVFAAERIHGDDTTVPVFAKVKTRTGRIWTYVRDDQPFGGTSPTGRAGSQLLRVDLVEFGVVEQEAAPLRQASDVAIVVLPADVVS